MTRIKRGFTLLEVMAAIVILSIGASAAFKLIGSSTRAIRKAEAVTVQANLARKVMADIETLYWQRKNNLSKNLYKKNHKKKLLKKNNQLKNLKKFKRNPLLRKLQ